MAAATAVGAGCDGGDPLGPSDAPPLAERAYVVSRDSDELAVVALPTMSVAAVVRTGGQASHMAELSADLGKVYVTSAGTGEVIVVDATKLTVAKRISVGRQPTHLALAPGGRHLAVMVEGEGEVVFVDTERDAVSKRLAGFHHPHFIRFDRHGAIGYVANAGGSEISRIDMHRLERAEDLRLAVPPRRTGGGDHEDGFADAQIDRDGRLYAAHHGTGRVLVYDTERRALLPELAVGAGAWVVFAQHPFANVPQRHVVPSFAARAVSLIDGGAHAVAATLPGDEEAYGVNFSSRTPERAFVMNRVRKDVAVVDTAAGSIVGRIPVGGNTETAATTADGSMIVAAVSGANQVVLIDPVTAAVRARLGGVGKYPWSVTIPGGQNYCH